MDWIRYLGRFTLTAIRNLGKPGVFLLKSLFWTFAPPFKFSRFIKQLEFIGVKSTFIVLLTGAFTGMVLGIQGYYSLNKFGAEALLGPAVALSLIRELGPVISALMVTGRAGSALTAEIGIMRISEQIDALEIMALSPFRYLIVPNLLAGIISLPLLGSIFNVVGIYGGYLVGVNLLGLNEGAYFGEMQNYVDMQDIIDGLTKSLCFGVIISWICCYKGYTAGYGAAGVSKATTQAVVAASVFILIWDYFLTSVMF
ncbi:MAG TPA: MlaE family lipid ABC transporter permease subunit [Thermodesulfobacteriota bacterium]|nr:ABC transporter permease [Deltaproteobacteria bacterium]HNR13382.1 MlaE family lipid ABC transporter permease subunit [Thermodesulfobacteriota bacterium]HNU70974.1 MlaE family lipid ABC transporter permease subunit [Thermodesulfobacteriota bacterium]HOC39739.1 MlaE family lipid ABC transporter permease subunit [Thermodesulfobacteriota bacterium]HQO77714.1 MlaE family lipid ABC transporter permease subunit [Thermodesulfobacteriota bacterium]